MNKIEIGENGKAVVKWKVLSYDYSHEAEDEVRTLFAKKYGISKENVSVDAIIYNVDNDGNETSIGNEIITDIQNPEFQQKLFKEFIKIKGIEDCDFDIIKEIDSTINNSLNYESYEKHKKYFVKWIKWSNFMSYGPNNYFDFENLKGLVLLSSEPANQGGKTTFCLDLLRFLLFGKVTSRESEWVLAKAFNRHLPEATEVVVEGCINIDGNDYIIKRTLTRPSLKKRTDKSKVSQKIQYYRLVNDEYIELGDDTEQEEGISVTETNKKIKEAIGNERDFDLMICVDSSNLKELISLKDTDRGRLLARWVGLLPLEDKDKYARETYNKTILPSLLINKYNRVDIETYIEETEKEDEELTTKYKSERSKKRDAEKNKEGYLKEKETLLSSYASIDEKLSKTDITTVQSDKDRYYNDGLIKKNEKDNNTKILEQYKDIAFNESEYNELIKKDKELSIALVNARNKYSGIKKEIEILQKGEYCPTCGAKLENVDNSKKIADKQAEIEVLKQEGIVISKHLQECNDKIEEQKDNKAKYDLKNKYELIIAKNEVDIETIRNKYKEFSRLLKDIQANKDAIEKNNNITTSINLVNSKIKVEEKIINDAINVMATIEATVKSNKKNIEKSKQIIEQINKEEVLVRNWKIYLDMVGKNGISKMVLKNALPLINIELKRLLKDVCDFTVEISIDDHNDVIFNMVHDGVYSNLASGSGFEQTVSSLALRSVLSKISSFSKPSFVVFDEILGGVAKANYENVKLLYDKIAKDYNMILQITHNENIFDWHNSRITVRKENNISKINLA